MCEAILASWLHPTFKHLLVTLDKGSFSLCDSGDEGAIFWYPSFAHLLFKCFAYRVSIPLRANERRGGIVNMPKMAKCASRTTHVGRNVDD